MLILNAVVAIATWLIGYHYPELVTTYSRGGNYFDSLAAFFIVGTIIYTLIEFQSKLCLKDEENKTTQRMFEQTATALVNAIDAKDAYTHGHSSRVTDYSRKITEISGKSKNECDEIYYTALLHDVGKIGVSMEIINKVGKLTNEEYETIKQHPGMGAQILESISECPYLMTGALYHHERYDGKGYPNHLKGKDIPEAARIVAVADAYDAMTSQRSYRDAIPQHIVREELVKGIGTQFDPEFAKIMIHLIDLDSEYKMQECISGSNVTASVGLHCESIYDNCTDGITITRKKATIRFCILPDRGFSEKVCIPTLIIFDALDGKVHPGEESNKDLLYYEYAKLRLDGTFTNLGARKVEFKACDQKRNNEHQKHREKKYKIEAVRNRDHVLVRITTGAQVFEGIMALPDTARYVYLSISGEHCEIHNIAVETAAEDTAPDSIPRIAEEISYSKDCLVGDLPNIEVDGPRLVTSEGITIGDDMTLSFHTKSYPTARLIWHCPYFCIFSSANGQVDGEDYHEYLLLKLDGENWDSAENVENQVNVKHTQDFKGWASWMEQNKQGLDCSATIKREDNKIIMQTENLGIILDSVTTILDDVSNVSIALTGDQCAITNIRIQRA
ncbi:MAG: HD-GYP domain-containing protein [Oscillospiraceae bacterium]|nr:HD-GYP domain-containing protein [Oscillospiraceae bacterium]